jgi:hypothetical protein
MYGISAAPLQLIAPAVAVNPPLHVINTPIPFIGSIDFSNPLEWLVWGGVLADLLLVKGDSKWLIAAGLIAGRMVILKAIPL